MHVDSFDIPCCNQPGATILLLVQIAKFHWRKRDAMVTTTVMSQDFYPSNTNLVKNAKYTKNV